MTGKTAQWYKEALRQKQQAKMRKKQGDPWDQGGEPGLVEVEHSGPGPSSLWVYPRCAAAVVEPISGVSAARFLAPGAERYRLASSRPRSRNPLDRARFRRVEHNAPCRPAGFGAAFSMMV